jgi:Flp pilus assembly protein TadB
MDLERRRKTPRRSSGMSMPARLVLGALAIFGAVTLVSWVLASIIAFVKFGLLVIVIIGVGAWVVNAKGSR